MTTHGEDGRGRGADDGRAATAPPEGREAPRGGPAPAPAPDGGAVSVPGGGPAPAPAPDGGAVSVPQGGGPAAASGGGAEASVPGELSALDKAVLAVERRSWPSSGPKERYIRERLALSPTRYYQLLNALLDDPRALRHDPGTVNRLLRRREARRGRR